MHLPTHKGTKLGLALIVIGAGMFLVNRLIIPKPEAELRPVTSAAAPAASTPAAEPEISKKLLKWDADHFNKDDKPFTGVAVESYPDGKLKQRWRFKEGKWHGLVEEYYPTGLQSVATNFDNGDRQGESTYWNPDGTVQKKQWFEKGTLVKEEKPEHNKP